MATGYPPCKYYRVLCQFTNENSEEDILLCVSLYSATINHFRRMRLLGFKPLKNVIVYRLVNRLGKTVASNWKLQDTVNPVIVELFARELALSHKSMSLPVYCYGNGLEIESPQWWWG